QRLFVPGEFGQVALPELVPVRQVFVKPLAELVGRCELLEPFVQAGFFLGDAPRPQPVDQHPVPVIGRRRVVGSFDGDTHGDGVPPGTCEEFLRGARPPSNSATLHAFSPFPSAALLTDTAALWYD